LKWGYGFESSTEKIGFDYEAKVMVSISALLDDAPSTGEDNVV
jgi:hypothetical protein